jgi:hypothetical protein
MNMTAMKPQKPNAEFCGLFPWSLVILLRFIDIDWPQQLLFSTNQRKTAKITGKNLTVYTEL